MRVRSIGKAVVCAALLFAGCRAWHSSASGDDPNRLAVAPDPAALVIPSSHVAAAIDAAGGLAAWKRCRQLEVAGTVAAYRPDGSYYLTEHTYRLFPWSRAVRISADEPQCHYIWQIIGDQYQLVEGDPSLDVSPLADAYRGYAEAVLQIMTAPAQLLEQGVRLVRDPATVYVGGRPYHAIEARVEASSAAAASTSGLRHLQRTYYQDDESSRIEMVWLGGSGKAGSIMVRGYDYVSIPPDKVQIPTKIEVFHSDAPGRLQDRFVQVDIRLQP